MLLWLLCISSLLPTELNRQIILLLKRPLTHYWSSPLRFLLLPVCYTWGLYVGTPISLLVNMLKPMYSFGKWLKWKISLMGFDYRVVWVLKALWIFLSKTINFLNIENCIKRTFSGCPRKFYHRVMYIAPSSGHISLNFDLPFKLILDNL